MAVRDEPPQSVRNAPGSMMVTLMPSGFTAVRSTSEKPSIPNFAVWQAPMPGVPPTRPPMEENWMKWPERPAPPAGGRDGQPHSARSTVATDVRAARQPGTMAVRMARASADMATAATVTIEMAGEPGPQEPAGRDSERDTDHRPDRDGYQCLPDHHGNHLPADESQRLQQRKITGPAPDRGREGQGERHDSPGREHPGEDERRGAHRPVVDDLGWPLDGQHLDALHRPDPG